MLQHDEINSIQPTKEEPLYPSCKRSLLISFVEDIEVVYVNDDYELDGYFD
jgi:hypothetical protein